MPYHTIPTTRPLADLGDSRQPSHTGPSATTTDSLDRGAANPLNAIPQVLASAAGTVQARGLWRGHNAGISVVAAISQSARSIYSRHALPVERAAEIALMQHLGIDPDEMSLRAIAMWEDRSDADTVVAALRDTAAEFRSKLFGGAA